MALCYRYAADDDQAWCGLHAQQGWPTCLRLDAAQPSRLCQYECPFCQHPALPLQELLLHLEMSTVLAQGSNGSHAAAEHRLASSILLHSSRAARLQGAPALVGSMPAAWEGSRWQAKLLRASEML